MRRSTGVALIFTLLVQSSVCAHARDLLTEANAAEQGPALELPSAHFTEATFTVPKGAEAVQLYLQPILRYRAPSHSAGVLRFAVNGAELGPEHSANKAHEYCPQGSRAYAGRAWALPAQPGFDTGPREDLGGLGYLFDITPLTRAGENTLRITHVAATDSALIRGVAVYVDGERIALQMSAPRMDANDPTKLEWNFAPNISEGKGLFLATDVMQSVRFHVRNADTAGAADISLELELPAGVAIETPWLPAGDGWTGDIKIASVPLQDGARRHTITLPDAAVVGPETDWITFEGNPLILYLRCSEAPGEYAMRWRSLSQGGEGEWMAAPLTVLPTPPEAPQPNRSPLGIWAYRTVTEASSDAEETLRATLREATCATLSRLGVSRLVLSDPDEVADAKAAGMIASLASPWSFNRTVYPTSTLDLAKARLNAHGEPFVANPYSGGMQWCPTYAAEHGAEVFGLITERIRDEGWDGFDLDHEGIHHQCFCERCRAAFARREGLDANALDWPAAAQPEGDLHEAWIEFHVWNVGRHVAAIRDAVKAGNPSAPLFSWFTMSLYEATADGPHAETYHRRVREEREIGYDITQFLPLLDFANMANGVYPKGEDTWEYEFGLTWAFNRVEATVDNQWDVPLAPCLNFGAGAGDSWTSFEYLRWQAKTHVAQGVRGLDFWMLPFFDGRHYTLLSELARILSATEDIAWDGQRADDLVTIDAPEGIFHRAFSDGERTFVGITNRTLEPVTVALGREGGTTVPTGEAVDDSVPVPPLDGVFVVWDMQ